MPQRSVTARPPAAGPAPDEAALRAAALAHLARYAATRAGLLRVLERRIERWAKLAAAAGAEGLSTDRLAAQAAARQVVAELAAEGSVSDEAFAETRARRLARAGRSRQAVAAHLASHGVEREVARAVLPNDPQRELAAALALARRRRLGPFRTGTPDAATRLRELGVLARAGFSHEVASRALATDLATAEALVAWLRRE
jgi:regulatory protein